MDCFNLEDLSKNCAQENAPTANNLEKFNNFVKVYRKIFCKAKQEFYVTKIKNFKGNNNNSGSNGSRNVCELLDILQKFFWITEWKL